MIKRILLSVALLACAVLSKAQSIVIQEGDTIFICQPDTVTLHAQFQGTDSSNLESSTPLSTVDDTHSGVIDIGFPFTFYGNTYTQCVLSTNNYITFDLSNADQYSPWPINNPVPDPGYPANNAIFGPWHDTYPGAGGAPQPGWVSYTTVGDAPNRVFIFNMCMVPMFSCVTEYYSGQIKLFETTNNIEFHITHKDVCDTWNTGQAVLGIQNADGTVGQVVNGYDAGVQWTADNVAYRLTPNASGTYDESPISYDPVQVYATNQLQWNGNGITDPVYSDTVAPYITESGWVHVEFFGCFGTTLSQAGADSIYIAIGDPATVTSQRVSACNNPADNALIAHFLPGETAPFDLVWTDSSGNVLRTDSNEAVADSLVNIPAGHYNLQVTNAVGCVLNYSYDLPVHTMTPDFTYAPSLICQLSPVTFTNTSTGSISNYTWYFGDTNVDTAQNPVHPYAITGDSILVTLTIRNDTFPDCTLTDSALLAVHPNIVAAAFVDSPRCVGINIFMKDKSLPYPESWQWFDGDSLISTDSAAFMLKPAAGSYPMTLVVTDSLCGADTLNALVNVFEFPVVDLGNDTLLCPGESIALDAGNPGAEHAWSTGQNTQNVVLTPAETMPVTVTVTNNGCSIDDEILITMNCSMIFPNAFTPNHDGFNDRFLPHLVNMKSYDFFVYNRWGEQVFASTGNTGDAGDGWDGAFHNVMQPIGVYVYYAQGIDIKDQPVKTMGTVSLLR